MRVDLKPIFAAARECEPPDMTSQAWKDWATQLGIIRPGGGSGGKRIKKEKEKKVAVEIPVAQIVVIKEIRAERPKIIEEIIPIVEPAKIEEVIVPAKFVDIKEERVSKKTQRIYEKIFAWEKWYEKNCRTPAIEESNGVEILRKQKKEEKAKPTVNKIIECEKPKEEEKPKEAEIAHNKPKSNKLAYKKSTEWEKWCRETGNSISENYLEENPIPVEESEEDKRRRGRLKEALDKFSAEYPSKKSGRIGKDLSLQTLWPQIYPILEQNIDKIAKIRALRAIGLSYDRIAVVLNVSRHLVCYSIKYAECNTEKEIKSITRAKSRKREETKVEKDPLWVLKTKLKWFLDRGGNDIPFTINDVIAKFGPNPICYLTGEPIDYSKFSSFSLDHVIPVSKGGKSNLDNMGLLRQDINYAKSNLSVEEFKNLCRRVSEYSKPV